MPALQPSGSVKFAGICGTRASQPAVRFIWCLAANFLSPAITFCLGDLFSVSAKLVYKPPVAKADPAADPAAGCADMKLPMAPGCADVKAD